MDSTFSRAGYITTQTALSRLIFCLLKLSTDCHATESIMVFQCLESNLNIMLTIVYKSFSSFDMVSLKE